MIATIRQGDGEFLDRVALATNNRLIDYSTHVHDARAHGVHAMPAMNVPSGVHDGRVHDVRDIAAHGGGAYG